MMSLRNARRVLATQQRQHSERSGRETRIRYIIISCASLQVILGAVVIALSFTIFASSSAEKLRNASPYWAGFTVLFTGSVGFLTWKQLSIVSIGIYTFLSAVSVIVHLVATVLTGDTAGFLRSFHKCVEVNFEHACGCCVENTSCKIPYKVPGVRNCDIINGMLQEMLYTLCSLNVVCCLICLALTVMGCTLVAQYTQYNQSLGFRWFRTSAPANYHDSEGYNWLAFPSAPSNYIPPCAPPVYHPTSQPGSAEDPRDTGPPTVFDPVDFPPPYSSREPSLYGQHAGYYHYSPVSSGAGSSVEGAHLGTGYHSPVSLRRGSGHEDQGGLGSTRPNHVSTDSSETSRDVTGSRWSHGDDNQGECSTSRGDNEQCSTSRDTESGDNEGHRATSRDIRDDMQYERCSTSTSSSDGAARGNQGECSTTRDTDEHCHRPPVVTSLDRKLRWPGPRVPLSTESRRHSSPHSYGNDDVNYDVHGEVHHSVIAPNINPWSTNTVARLPYPRHSLPHKKRANSIPNCIAKRHNEPCDQRSTQLELHINDTRELETLGEPADKPAAATTDTDALDDSCVKKDCKKRKPRRHRRKKRPRNNPDHILQNGGKTSDTPQEYKETRL